MRGELYVLTLLTLWEEARRLAEHHYPRPQRYDILRDLLEADSDSIGPTFQLLADRLQQGLLRVELPRFGDDDFALLLRSEPLLSQELRCGPDPLGVLFDPEPITLAIDEVVSAPLPHGADARGLLEQLQQPGRPAAVRRKRGKGDLDWNDILIGERWIRADAVDLLKAAADRRRWPADAEPTRILAGILHGPTTPAAAGLGDRFDTIGVAALRRRVASLAATLREEADHQIQQAREAAPRRRELTLLHGWIELYDQQAIARGLLKLCGGTATVGSLLGDADVEATPAGMIAEPEPDGFLTVVDVGQPYPRKVGVFKRVPSITFDLACRCHGFSEPQRILHVVGLPVDDYAILRRGLVMLRGRDLSLAGATLAERVLSTEVASCHRLDGLLRAAVEDHVHLIAQTIVLSGLRKPIDAVVPWRHDLSQALRVPPDDRTSPPTARATDDVGLPNDVQEIVKSLEKEYEGKGPLLVEP